MQLLPENNALFDRGWPASFGARLETEDGGLIASTTVERGRFSEDELRAGPISVAEHVCGSMRST